MDLGIAGKNAVVTAGSKGLGRASAEALAAEGVNIVLNARNPDDLKQAAEEIRSTYGVRVVEVPMDVTSPTAATELLQRCVAELGSIDILITNAGGPPPRRALEVSDEDIDSALEANFKAMVKLMREAVPLMRERGFGRIVGIASSSIVQAIVSLPLSNAARIALWAWVKTAAHDLGQADLDVTINLACPGSHATRRMQELGFGGRMGDPADFGKVVAFLCSAQARFINGARIVVDGGQSLAL